MANIGLPSICYKSSRKRTGDVRPLCLPSWSCLKSVKTTNLSIAKFGLGVHIKKAFRSLDQKNLPPDELANTQEAIDTVFSESYPFVGFFWLEKIGWDRALELKASTNISVADCIHLATAIEAGCDLLVTLDTFFRKEAESFIKSCLPEQVNKTLQELGFNITAL